jgi:hypothetical protein
MSVTHKVSDHHHQFWTVVRNGNRPPAVIKAVLRIDNHGSPKNERPSFGV